MAKSMTKTNSANEQAETEQVATTEKITTDSVKKVREFKDTDAIKCVSITVGMLGMIGIKSNISYKWAGYGDETDVEYQDLVAAVRSGKKHITEPYFIIQDNDFLAQFPEVEKIYGSMFSTADLENILKLGVQEMKATIQNLPNGAKESIKNIVSSQIMSGKLDSVQKIRALDEIFDTKFMLMTELYGE